jgi:NADPH-dependent ferric siderophore reductase
MPPHTTRSGLTPRDANPMPQISRTPTRRPVPDDMFGGRLQGSYLLDLEVVRVKDIAPHVRAITMASPDLVGFEYAPGQDLMFDFPVGGRSVRRRYTIRRADPRAGTADFEIELHDGGGPATVWAADTRPGSRLEAIGPRGGIRLLPDVPSHLFVADDSATPAAFAMLEAIPSRQSATALLVTRHGAASRPVPTTSSEIVLVWLDGRELGETLAELRQRDGAAAYVFGERGMVRTAEEILIAGGMARASVTAKAYWRRDQANANHGEPR